MTFERILKEKKVYFVMLLLTLWFSCIPSPSFALPVSSCEQGVNLSQDKEIINSFLEQELVVKKLTDMGLSKEEISSRLDKLSDTQIHALAMKVERIKAGGDGWVILIVIIALIAVIFFLLTHEVTVERKDTRR
ncbi:MAG: hypothetical protein COS99_01165 [Candidatus Omnitrophica bacterium CG07_land_8_20_14_0_80_42_15]|uniref:PA2779 family protein n=1 Tax=Candidatus Aquitaenariimonas noxiae TaxID=1974741 RepID=A0A2J0KUR3_9BACT|nr:MAG: hypothetical protein COS99_01165 [Candidatus Omnitrophica bacterium CG07_land_8_20_14_0_80_42_15]